MKRRLKYITFILAIFSISLVQLGSADTKPKNLGAPINTYYDEAMPSISADGTTMIFQTNRKEDSESDPNWDLWMADWDGTTWRNPRFIDGVNSEVFDGHASLSPDGKTIYFASNRPDNGDQNIWMTRKGKAGWGPPQKLPAPVNSEQLETFPSISADGTLLYFSRPDGIYSAKLISEKAGKQKWAKPIRLPKPINHSKKKHSNLAAIIHADGRTIYFSSNRKGGRGGYDIYSSRRTGKRWSKPKNLGKSINSKGQDLFLTITADGKYAYFSSLIEGSRNKEDIFRQSVPRGSLPQGVTLVRGKVFNAKTKDALSADISIEDLNTGKILYRIKSDAEGKYSLVLASGKNYGVVVEKRGFFFLSDNFDLRKEKKYRELKRDFGLLGLLSAGNIVLRNLFFRPGQSKLRKESRSELNRVVRILDQNPKVRVEIQGYTDNQGGLKMNKRLSEARARAVREYLVKKGIAKLRLSVVGYGPANPRASNKTAKGRAQNRRTELKVYR